MSVRAIVTGAWRGAAQRPGAAAAAAILAVFLGVAVSTDFPRVALGFKGDEATYYSLTHSIARDGDFTFQREDLLRVWEEFPGPEGIFLKRGSRLHVERIAHFPFVHIVQTPDPSRVRLFYGKSYLYPLFCAPFVRLFGTSGFLVFHALLLAISFSAGYAILVARGSSPAVAAGFAAVFIFASVTPVYFIWLTPELFNFTLVFTAFFLWAYKRAAPPAERAKRREWFFRSRASDDAAAVLLGLATFSKPTHVATILPLLGLALVQRRWRDMLKIGSCFAAVVLALFIVNAGVTGEFNYQGGERKTFYSATGFPFANTWETFDNRGQSVATSAVPTDILFHRDTASVLTWNVMYFFVGRYSGLVPYFFPGVLLALLFVTRPAHRQPWQWCVAGGLAAGAIGLLLYMPYTYSGGGGPIGNRYFLSFYPLFLFLAPPLRTPGPALAALAVGALFTAKITLNPFYSSFHPGEHATAGPLRILPIERTLLNDLPVSADPDRARRRLTGVPPMSFYFPDDGAFLPEGDSFWIKGGKRADILVRAPAIDTPDGRSVSLRIRTLRVEITNSDVVNRVVVSTGGGRARLDLAPGEVQVVELSPGAGVPYKPARFPMGFVYALSVSASTGTTPFLKGSGETDSRYLGALVRVVPVYYNP